MALKIVRDLGEAEDLTQTIFLDFAARWHIRPRKGSPKACWARQLRRSAPT